MKKEFRQRSGEISLTIQGSAPSIMRLLNHPAMKTLVKSLEEKRPKGGQDRLPEMGRFPELLKSLRERYELTPKEIARAAGTINEKTIRRCEKGGAVTMKTVTAICNAFKSLGVPDDEIEYLRQSSWDGAPKK